MLAVNGLAKMADTPYASARTSLQAKLRATIPESQRQRIDGLLQSVAIDVPQRKQRAPLLETVVEATNAGQPITIEYRGDAGVQTHTVRPTTVKADRGHWYLNAKLDGQTRAFRIDRILQVADADLAPDDSQELPYDHPSHPLVKVRLSPKGLRALERDPHLGDAAKPDADGGAWLEFRCPPSELQWYARYFGGMGEDAIVLGPKELIELIRERTRKILQIYSGR